MRSAFSTFVYGTFRRSGKLFSGSIRFYPSEVKTGFSKRVGANVKNE